MKPHSQARKRPAANPNLCHLSHRYSISFTNQQPKNQRKKQKINKIVDPPQSNIPKCIKGTELLDFSFFYTSSTPSVLIIARPRLPPASWRS